MRRLVLVRHGETAWNLEGRVQGSSDIALSRAGLSQARLLARYFASGGARFDRIYSSDLQRASATAQLLGEALGGPVVTASPLLREIGCGCWEGHPVEAIKRDRAEEYARWRSDASFAMEGGESVLAVRGRVARFFEAESRALSAAEVALVVGHGILNRMVLSVVMEVDPQRARYFGQDNTALNLFEFRRGRATCTAWNARPHLGADASLLPPCIPGAPVGGEI